MICWRFQQSRQLYRHRHRRGRWPSHTHGAVEGEEVLDDRVAGDDRVTDGEGDKADEGAPPHLNELAVRCTDTV